MMGKVEVEAAISALETSISTLDTLVLFFAALVAIGVVGEAALGVRHWMLDEKLRTFRRVESQLHENELAQLAKDTAEANARAAEATLELAKFKAPRTLSAEQQQRLVSQLSPFAGQTFSFTVLGDTEPTDLMQMIETVLISSGWVRVPSQIGVIEISGAGLIAGGVGVETQMPLQGDPKAWEYAKILASVLTAEGIVSSAKLNPALKNPQAINIMVGKKPQ